MRLILVFICLLSLSGLARAETDYPSRDEMKDLVRRVSQLESGSVVRVRTSPGSPAWSVVPGWRVLELVPSGSSLLAVSSPSNGAARVVVSSSPGSGGLGRVSVGRGLSGDGTSTNPVQVDPSVVTNLVVGEGLSGLGTVEDPLVVVFPPDEIGLSWVATGSGVSGDGTATNPVVLDLDAGWGLLGSGSTNPVSVDPSILPAPAFPLSGDADCNHYGVTNAGRMQATTGVFRLLQATASSLGKATSGDLTVLGNLVVTGTTTQAHLVNVYTQVNLGTYTNLITETVYTTHVVYQVVYVYTNIVSTNTVQTFVDVGGTWDATNSAWVALPHFTDTRGGSLAAIGAWNFAGATVAGLDAVTASNLLAAGDGLHSSSPAIVANNQATVHLESNCWFALDAASGITNLVAVTNGAAPSDILAFALEIYNATNAVNTWGWGGMQFLGVTNSVSTNAFFIVVKPSALAAWQAF